MSKRLYVPRRGDVIRLNFDPQKGNEKKGYPWEAEIPDNDFVSGVVLSDQMKSLDWRERRAEFVCTPAGGLIEDVVEKAVALLSPEEE